MSSSPDYIPGLDVLDTFYFDEILLPHTAIDVFEAGRVKIQLNVPRAPRTERSIWYNLKSKTLMLRWTCGVRNENRLFFRIRGLEDSKMMNEYRVSSWLQYYDNENRILRGCPKHSFTNGCPVDINAAGREFKQNKDGHMESSVAFPKDGNVHLSVVLSRTCLDCSKLSGDDIKTRSKQVWQLVIAVLHNMETYCEENKQVKAFVKVEFRDKPGRSGTSGMKDMSKNILRERINKPADLVEENPATRTESDNFVDVRWGFPGVEHRFDDIVPGPSMPEGALHIVDSNGQTAGETTSTFNIVPQKRFLLEIPGQYLKDVLECLKPLPFVPSLFCQQELRIITGSLPSDGSRNEISKKKNYVSDDPPFSKSPLTIEDFTRYLGLEETARQANADGICSKCPGHTVMQRKMSPRTSLRRKRTRKKLDASDV